MIMVVVRFKEVQYLKLTNYKIKLLYIKIKIVLVRLYYLN